PSTPLSKISSLSLHDALPIYGRQPSPRKLTPTGKKETINGYETEEFVYETPQFKASFWVATKYPDAADILKQMQAPVSGAWKPRDRKSTRLNSSHVAISYAVF